MQTLNKYAVIVAGGSGSRMKTAKPKQFLLLNGKPIIVHTIEKFLSADCNVIVVLPSSELNTWQEIKSNYHFLNNITIAEGGSSRFDSVKNGLTKINDDGIVCIHDAVRPMISVSKINSLINFAIHNGNAIAAIPCIDTARFEFENNKFEIIDRTKLWLMQTPQCFNVNDLKNAYHSATNSDFTDDAAVFENAGFTINLQEGEKTNLKITVPEDLKLAEFLLQQSD